MRHRYTYLDPELIRSLLAAIDLLRLFNQLVLAAAGDPARARAWLRELQERGYIDDGVNLDAFFAQLEEQGWVRAGGAAGGGLTAAGARQLRRSAFEEVFANLGKAGPGYHSIHAAGEGVESLPETRPYAFGDELSTIDASRSTQNALRRTKGELDLAEEDLEVSEREHLTSCATVVAIDISHSMVLYGEDRITPAKTVALAMTELITSKYPNDWLGVLAFGDRATRIDLADIPAISAGPFHTNTCEALEVARGMLARRRHPNKQIFLITDGKPSAVTEGHAVYKNPYGLDLKIVNRTLEEADRCRRQKVVITTFMIATDPMLQEFVEKLTKVNRGRAYFANPYDLGGFILADYVANRRRRVR
ncbi:MAG: VWA domain-containing protein [Thermoanaerobaculaceae bacterium]|nr:VWA domain-containing protein [Thermoanaerobaculaceae bacterium]